MPLSRSLKSVCTICFNSASRLYELSSGVFFAFSVFIFPKFVVTERFGALGLLHSRELPPFADFFMIFLLSAGHGKSCRYAALLRLRSYLEVFEINNLSPLR